MNGNDAFDRGGSVRSERTHMKALKILAAVWMLAGVTMIVGLSIMLSLLPA
jgi:hypothetical protein